MTMQRFGVLTVLVLPLLMSCGGIPKPVEPPAPAEPPLRFAVGSVAVADEYQPLAEANFIDERRTRELADVTRTLLEERVEAAGGPGWIRASLLEVKLLERLIEDRQGGVAGLVTREPTWRLEADVTARLTVMDETGSERLYAEAKVGRSRSVRAGASVVDRDNAARELIRDVVLQLNDALEEGARENLASWLVSS